MLKLIHKQKIIKGPRSLRKWKRALILEHRLNQRVLLLQALVIQA